MKLYYSKGACSLAVRILLHEIGITSEFEAVDLRTKRTQHGQDFLQINAKGSVPVLLLDDGTTALTENAVIQQYLAEHYAAADLLPPTTDLLRYRVLEWLNFITTDLHKGFSPLFNPNLPQAVRDSIFMPNIRNKLAYLDQHLSYSLYLVGERFTLPDAYLFVILRWLAPMQLQLSAWPNLLKFFQRIEARPSVQRALQEEA